ncbi:MAG: hypothetical protein L0I92_07240, partial [Staphylococcus equorum]|nr:hypothetical protein [Staphylococcus equorum]
SHDPRQRARSKVLHDKTGQMLGIDTDTQLLQEIVNLLDFNNDLNIEGNRNTKNILKKPSDIYMNSRKISEEVDREMGSMFKNELYNNGR